MENTKKALILLSWALHPIFVRAHHIKHILHVNLKVNDDNSVIVNFDRKSGKIKISAGYKKYALIDPKKFSYSSLYLIDNIAANMENE